MLSAVFHRTFHHFGAAREQSDMDVHDQSALGLDSRAVSDRVTKPIVTIVKHVIIIFIHIHAFPWSAIG